MDMNLPDTSLPPIDLKLLHETTQGEPELERELAEIFLEDTGQRLGVLRESLESGDAQNLAFNAHAVKGAAANIGALRFHDLAYRLEMRSKEQVMREAKALLAELEREFARIREFLVQRFQIS